MSFKFVVNDEVVFESKGPVRSVLITSDEGAVARYDNPSMRIMKVTVKEKDGLNPELDEVEVKPKATTKPKKKSKKSTAFKAHKAEPKVSQDNQEIDDNEVSELGGE